jgi:hypothetical protein
MATVNTYRDFSFASQERYPVISNIEFLLEPQIVKQLFNVNPLQSDIGDFMKMGLMEMVEGEEVIHREERRFIDAPYLNSSTTVTDVYGTASVGNGDPTAFSGYAYVQLAASAHTPTSGDLTNTFSYPRVGDIVEFRGQYFWRVQGKRETVANAHRLYLTKLDASYPNLSSIITLTGSTYGGDQITLPAPAFEEATWGRRDGLIPTFKTFRSYITSFGEVYKVTSKQMSNKTYPIIDPETGGEINFWYVIGSRKTEEAFMLQEAMGLFVVPKADSSAVAYDPVSGTQKTLVTSGGYIPTLVANAPGKQYDDNVTLALFKDLARLRNRLNQSGDSMVWHGPEFAYRVSDLITQIGDSGSIVYDHKAVDLGISTIKIPGAAFNLKDLRILDNPQLTNLPGRPYPWYFIVKPMDKKEDAKTGIPMDCFTIMYKKQAGGGARGHYKVWQTGAYAPVPTSEERVCNTNYASDKGVRVVAAEKHILGQSSQF